MTELKFYLVYEDKRYKIFDEWGHDRLEGIPIQKMHIEVLNHGKVNISFEIGPIMIGEHTFPPED